MATQIPETALQLRTEAKASGQLTLSLVEAPLPQPGPDEVIVRVEAAPMSPSDLALLVGGADPRTARATGNADRPELTLDIPEAGLRMMAGRLDKSLRCGNEGAGLVVKAGSSEAAQALVGKRVAAASGSMYANYTCLHRSMCMVLPDGASAEQGAASFVNPMTALGMLETMRSEGHSALVHTAAASNLGRMLNRLCNADGIGLVNIVRRPEQVELLREQGAKHVLNSETPSFVEDLVQALKATGATLCFDAVGGGKLAGRVLVAMEAAASSQATEYSRYGTSKSKQVYVYGRLDTSATQIPAGVGMTWGVGGWLLPNFLQQASRDVAGRMSQRVMAELTTTFASAYGAKVNLRQALEPSHFQAYQQRSTDQKYLITPEA